MGRRDADPEWRSLDQPKSKGQAALSKLAFFFHVLQVDTPV